LIKYIINHAIEVQKRIQILYESAKDQGRESSIQLKSKKCSRKCFKELQIW